MALRLNPSDFATPREAGDLLRRYLEKPSRRVEIEAGLVDVSQNPTRPLNWHLSPGSKIDMHPAAVLKSHAADVGDGCCFTLYDGVEIFGGALEGPFVDDPLFTAAGLPHVATVGMAGARNYGVMQARLHGLRVSGGNWQVYAWAQNLAAGWRLTIERSTIVGGRIVVVNGNTGGDNQGDISLDCCQIFADWRLGWSDPASRQGARVYGVYGRGGRTALLGGLVSVAAGDGCDEAGCLWIPQATSPPGREHQADYEGGAPAASIVANGTRLALELNGAKTGAIASNGTGKVRWIRAA